MVLWYDSSFLVHYDCEVNDDISELAKLCEMDEEFSQELDHDLKLQKTFADQLLIKHNHFVMTNEYLNDERMDKIRHALLNKASFATKQKERLKRNIDRLGAQERKRVAYEVDQALQSAIYYMEGFKDNCIIIRRQFELTSEAYEEDVIPRSEWEEMDAAQNPEPEQNTVETGGTKDVSVVTSANTKCANFVSSNAPKCVICCEEDAEVAIIPCGHMCLCILCSTKEEVLSTGLNNHCPICRASIKGTLKVVQAGFM